MIECKNENKTPSGSYLSKLHSILSVINAGGKENGIKFGIIISIFGKELEELFKTKGNLLELLERKASEIIMDATTDMKSAGLYDV